MQGERLRARRRRITGIVIILVILFTGLFITGVLTSDGPEYQMRASAIEENHILKEQIAELEAEVKKLKKELNEKEDYISTLPSPEPESETESEAESDESYPKTPRD